MEKRKKGTKPLIRKWLKISSQNKEAKINPVRNSSGPSPRRSAAMVREHGGSGSGHAGGALKPTAGSFDPEALDGQRSIISNGVNNSYRESESIYKKLVEASLQGIVIAQGIPPHLVYANPAISRILGYSPDELTSLTFKQIQNLIHLDDRLKFFSQYKDRLEGKSVGPSYEIRAIRKDGGTVWLELSATQIEYNGEPAVLATYVDITQRKRAETVLQESEDRYRTLVNSMQDGVYLFDKNGYFIFVNPSMEQRSGFTVEKFKTFHFLDILPPEYHKEARNNFEHSLRGEQGPLFEMSYRTANGAQLYMEVNTIPLVKEGEVVAIMGISHNITERKQAEKALKESKETLGMTLDGINADIYIADMETYEILFMNKHMKDSYGDDLVGKICWQFFRGDSGPCLHCTNPLLLDSEGNPTPVQVWEGRNPITNRYYLNYDRAIRWIDGHYVRLQIATDITERKKTEEALTQSEERYRTILENIEDGYYEVDLPGNFTFFNDSLCRMLGYSKDELMGMNNLHYSDEENAKKLYQAFNKVFQTGQPAREFDWEVIRKDGARRFGEVSISLIKDSEGQPIGFRGIARDVTERKRAEKEIKHSISLLNATLESTADGVLVVDRVGKIVSFNQKFAQMWHIPESIIASRDDDQALAFVLNQLKYPEDFLSKVKELYSQPSAESFDLLEFQDGRVFERYSIAQRIGEQIVGRVWSFRDVTDRKRAEEALGQSEERYRTLVEESFDGVFIQKGFKITFANRRLHEMLGYKEGELEGFNHWLVYHPDYQALTLERAKARMRGESVPSTYEVKFLRKDGSSFWGEIHAKVINVLGEPGIQVWARDISERKQAEETLRAEREKFRSLSESAPFGMAMIDKDGIFKYINPKFKELFGYDLSDVPDGKTWFRKAYPDPDYRHQIISSWLDDLASSKSGEKRPRFFTAKCKDASEKIINFISVQLEAGENLFSCEDITERKHAEEALRESEERYRTILENIEDGYYEVDLPGNFTFFNDSLCRILGYSREEMIGMGNQQYTDQENRKTLFQAFNKVYNTGKSIKGFDWKVFRKDGTKLFGEVSVSLMKDSKGQSIGFRGIARDITERKQAEEALRRSEESSRELAQENAIMAEIGRIISLTLNIDEVYERFSEEFNKLIPFDRIAINILDPKINTVTVAYVTGVDIPDARKGNVLPLPGSANEEILRTRSSLLLRVEDMDDFQHRFPGLFTTYQAGLRSMMSVPLFSKDQIIGVLHIRSFNPNAYSERDLGLAERVGHQIAGAIANAQLFKELMQAEEDKIAIQEQFRQSQKMEAIGGLAGGIAHDFNNLLTVIKGYAELSCLGLDTSDPLRGNIEEILKASERAANLTRQLLAFSRRQILALKVINLNTLLKDLDKMLHRILGEDIDLVYHLPEDIGKVKTDPGQIEQVILNLAVNARDAMPSGGKLTIQTLNMELSEAYAQTHMEVIPGNYVMLSVSDSGAGMAPKVRERIFEPFFTTKEKGKGTGLGLSTVYGIVKQSGGNINVYSEPGLGTTFKIYLPRVEEEEDHLQRKDLDISPSTGNETILLTEDEQSVRELAARILRDRGYQVYEAPDGKEALAIAQRHPERKIHLLLTDVVMPGMSGKELADRLKLSIPDIKVLFISGYTDNAIVHHGVLDKGVNFIQKPFTPESLARKLREVLDR